MFANEAGSCRNKRAIVSAKTLFDETFKFFLRTAQDKAGHLDYTRKAERIVMNATKELNTLASELFDLEDEEPEARSKNEPSTGAATEDDDEHPDDGENLECATPDAQAGSRSFFSVSH